MGRTGIDWPLSLSTTALFAPAQYAMPGPRGARRLCAGYRVLTVLDDAVLHEPRETARQDARNLFAAIRPRLVAVSVSSFATSRRAMLATVSFRHRSAGLFSMMCQRGLLAFVRLSSASMRSPSTRAWSIHVRFSVPRGSAGSRTFPPTRRNRLSSRRNAARIFQPVDRSPLATWRKMFAPDCVRFQIDCRERAEREPAPLAARRPVANGPRLSPPDSACAVRGSLLVVGARCAALSRVGRDSF